MKKVWARIGVMFEMSDEDHEKLKEAVNDRDGKQVREILSNSHYYMEGESYLPIDCEDNPNTSDFEF